jgi:MFS family permease
MQAAGFGCLGFFLGAIVGGVIGVALGFAWTSVFHTSDFEGYSGMLVFLTFMPIGIIAGGILGAAGLAMLASRDEPTSAPDTKKPVD